MAENKGIQYIEILAAGGTELVAADDGIDKYMIESTGSVTLTSNWSITGSGSPRYGTTFTVQYFADIIPDGNSLTFFGVAMPSNLTNKNVEIEATYDGSAYKVVFKPSLAEAGVIPAAALEVSQDVILTNSYASVIGATLSATTAEQDVLVFKIPGGTLDTNAQHVEAELNIRTAANTNAKAIRLRVQQGGVDAIVFDSSTTITASPNNYIIKSNCEMFYQDAATMYIENASMFYDGSAYDLRVSNAGPVPSLDFTQDVTVKLTVELASGIASDVTIRRAVLTIKK